MTLSITVAIPTCNRPQDLERCMAALADVAYTDWRVLIVDQSDGVESRDIAMAWRSEFPPLDYIHMPVKNLSAARNRAIERASGDVLAFIDDDCTAHPSWLQDVARVFEKHRDAQVIYGSVTAIHHDPATAFVPALSLPREKRLKGALGALRVRGIGASMYIRLTPSRPLVFDTLLCPGGRLRSGEDWDYAYRAVHAGQLVLETPDIDVTHHGVRTYSSGRVRATLRDYHYGVGASHAKLLRCGQWIMVAVIADKLARSVVALRPHHAIRHRPTQFGRLLQYISGLRDGSRIPINSREAVFA